MTLIDTNRFAIIHSDLYDRFNIVRYIVPEPRESCAFCGGEPGRFVYTPDSAPDMKRIGSSGLAWIDSPAFCSVRCCRAYRNWRAYAHII